MLLCRREIILNSNDDQEQLKLIDSSFTVLRL